MIVYSVYEPPGEFASRRARADELVFVRDAFSRPTIVLGPIWLVFKQQWDSLLAYMLLGVVIAGLCFVAEIPKEFWGYFYLGLNIIFALEQPLLRGTLLEAKGWRLIGVTEGRTQEEAEYRFLNSWLSEAEPTTTKPKSVVSGKIDLQAADHDKISSVLREARPPRILN